MICNPANPIVTQGDGSILLEVNNPRYQDARDFLARFAELEKSPEHIHTYRVTPLSLWNAASAGLNYERIREGLEDFSKFDVPQHVLGDIEDKLGRFGMVRLYAGEHDDSLKLVVTDDVAVRTLTHNRDFLRLSQGATAPGVFRIGLGDRGVVKQLLLKLGYPVDDRAGFVDGAPLAIKLAGKTGSGRRFRLRGYQREAVEIFYRSGGVEGGNGVVVLPCGAGKTIVAIGTMAEAGVHTLILATGISAVRQWIREVIDKTNLTEDQVGEYTGENKTVKPVTVTTYQILTHRKRGTDEFTHLGLFSAADWGLIVYDEVHLLPAPVFRITSEIQARRRLGLTATLVREDGREGDVFSLIGPKRYDVPWKELEKKGFIATAQCHEIRLDLPEREMKRFRDADKRAQHRIAAENSNKIKALMELLEIHQGDHVLIIGMYLKQLRRIAKLLDVPVITGKTPNPEREKLYQQFRAHEIPVLVVSKVANFSIDLPDANVAIQVSGTFGSRQEEAQRLGRILRPGGGEAHFYTLVTRNSPEQRFAHNRQLFLTEQGYSYAIEEWEEEEGLHEASTHVGGASGEFSARSGEFAALSGEWRSRL